MGREINTQDKAFFVTLDYWENLEKNHGKIVFHPGENSFYRIIEQIEGSDYSLQPLGGDSPIMANIENFMTREQFMQQRKQDKSAQNQSKIRAKSEQNQYKTNHNTDPNQSKNSTGLDINPSEYKSLSEILQSYFEEIDEDIYSQRPDVEKARMAFNSARDEQNLNRMLKNLNYLKKFRNKQKGAEKGRAKLTENPYPTREVNMRDHKKAVKYLRSNKFIKKATQNRYKNWRQLPATCPNSIPQKLDEIQVFSKKGEQYTVPLTTKILGKMKQKDMRRTPTASAIFASVVILPILIGLVYNIFIAANTTPQKTEPQKPVVTKARIEKAIKKWENTSGKPIYDWRRDTITKHMKAYHNRLSQKELMKQVHKFNSKKIPYHVEK